jgi:hypothetical protein
MAESEPVAEDNARDKCPNCFSDLNPEEPNCPVCGFDASGPVPPSGIEPTEEPG